LRLSRANSSTPTARSCFLSALLTAATDTCNRSAGNEEQELLGKLVQLAQRQLEA
jgi:hypothetical protein